MQAHDAARHGAQQPERFDPARAARLDDPARFAYLPPLELVALLDLAPSALLLDFGTGTGTYAVEIARARPDVRIIALDEQAEMLTLLREKLATAAVPNVEPVAPGQLSDFDGRVDRILALNVLHELGDSALAALRALMHTNGTALFVDWNADIERPHGPPAEHVYGPDRARQRLEAHGLRVTAERLFPYHYALTAVRA